MTTNRTLAGYHFCSNQSIDKFFFNIKIGDRLKLLSPTLTELATVVCDTLSVFSRDPISIVINEINYNSVEPVQFRLYQNYPNPFNQKTTIIFDLSEPGFVELRIYNVKGQLVRRLKPDFNEHSIICDMSGFSSGIYFYQIKLNDKYTPMKKTILFK